MSIVSSVKELYIFGLGAGKDGQGTLKFQNVTNLEEHIIEGESEVLNFEYVSASTGEKREAYFYLRNISGFSYTE